MNGVHRILLEEMGDPGWWSDDPFTVMFQAVLVQNSSWSSVERVAASYGRPDPEKVLSMSDADLQAVMAPCGLV